MALARSARAARPLCLPNTRSLDREADVLGVHDFVGRALFEHAVLMDAGLVGEGVLADDRLVPLHLDAGDVGHQPAGGHQPRGC